jgi:PST family polysaccharide transporter/lipopolysaccharide exporter
VSLLGRVRRSLVPSGDLTERAVKSGAWSGATNTLTRLVQLAKVVILARLLSPAEFGLVGIGFLVLAVFKHFSELGVDAALIQRREEQVDEYLDTVWVLRVVRGAAIAVVAYLVAPSVAALFGEPRAAPVVRVLGLSPLLLGFRNPGVLYFQKHLQFHRRFVQLLSGTAVNFVVAVTLGVLYGNVWALVLGSIAGNLTTVAVSYRIHAYRPRPRFELARAREMLDYGKWILGTTGLLFLVNQGDDAFVGWFLGATALGFYQMAFRFSNAPATEITQVVANVVFPTYSRVQDDVAKLRSGFYRTVRLTTFVSFPAAAGIVVVAPEFVRVFLGPTWTPIAPVMQLLAVWGLLRSLVAAVGPLFRAVGRPDVDTKLQAARLAVIVALVYPATARYGLLGTSGVVVLSGLLVVVPASSWMALRIVDGTASEFLQTLAYPAVGSALMVAVIWAVRASVTTGVPVVDFAGLVATGVVTYAAFTGVAVNVFDYEIRREFRTIYESFA